MMMSWLQNSHSKGNEYRQLNFCNHEEAYEPVTSTTVEAAGTDALPNESNATTSYRFQRPRKADLSEYDEPVTVPEICMIGPDSGPRRMMYPVAP